MFGKKLKKIREDLGLSQKGLSDLTEIPKSTIDAIENNKVKYPRMDVLQKLAKLGYSPEYLLLGEKEREPVEEILKKMPEDKLEVYKIVQKALDGDPSALENLKFLLKGLEAKK